MQSVNRLLVDSVHLEFDKLQVLQQHKATKGIIISDHMYEQVMDITDDLFLLRVGYTFPIKSREDLIHHGYILR